MVACLVQQIVDVEADVHDQWIMFQAAVIELPVDRGEHAGSVIATEPAGGHVLRPGGAAEGRAQADTAVRVIGADAYPHDIVDADDGECSALTEIDAFLHASQFDRWNQEYKHAAECAVMGLDPFGEIQHFAFSDTAGERYADMEPVVGMLYVDTEMFAIAEIDGAGTVRTSLDRIVAENQFSVGSDQSEVLGRFAQQREIVDPLIEFGDSWASFGVDRHALDDRVHRASDVIECVGQLHRESGGQIAAIDQPMLQCGLAFRPDQAADEQPHQRREQHGDADDLADNAPGVAVRPAGDSDNVLGFAHAVGLARKVRTSRKNKSNRS